MTKLIDSLCGVKALDKRNRIQDSLQEDKENRSKVLSELKELLKSVPYDKIVEALDYFMSPEEVAKFTKLIREFYGIEPPVSDSSDAEYRQFDRFNDLREEVSDKEIVDVLPSYMGGYEINKFVDKVRNFYGLDQNHDGEIEDSKDEEMTRRKSSKRKVSDAAYNPKFEKLRKVLSDTTIVEELSHYMSSDELEEFTETLTRNYDIDLDSEVLDSSDSSRKEVAYSYLEENEDEDIEDKNRIGY